MWQLNLKCSHFTVNLNISFCVQHNMEVAHILDHYVIGRMVIVSTALELVAFTWIYGELSVWMPTATRYVDSHSCLEFNLIGFLNFGTNFFPITVIWKISENCLWVITGVYLNQSERRHHKQIDIPLCYQTPNTFHRTKQSADNSNHAPGCCT